MIISSDHFQAAKKAVGTLIIIIAALLLTFPAVSHTAETDDQAITLKQSIAESLELENNLLSDLEQSRNRIKQLEPILAVEMEAYKVLHTTCTNMLARQVQDQESLEQAAASVKAAAMSPGSHQHRCS